MRVPPLKVAQGRWIRMKCHSLTWFSVRPRSKGMLPPLNSDVRRHMSSIWWGRTAWAVRAASAFYWLPSELVPRMVVPSVPPGWLSAFPSKRAGLAAIDDCELLVILPATAWVLHRVLPNLRWSGHAAWLR